MRIQPRRRQELQRAGFTVPWTEPVFVKGDAIAGILITIINLVGGICSSVSGEAWGHGGPGQFIKLPP